MKISLALLVFNELEGCRLDVPALPEDEFCEVIAVDGGSTDGSVEYLTGKGIPVYRQPQKGLNAAYIHAVEKAKGDAVVVFFPKGTINPATLRSFRPLLEQGMDLVIAGRNLPGGRNEEDGCFFKPRKWGVLCLAYLAALLWREEGRLIRDVLHGYKGFTVAAFRKIAPRENGVSIDMEMTVRAYKHKLQVAEFPVQEKARCYGTSHFPVIPTGLKLARCLWQEYWSS